MAASYVRTSVPGVYRRGSRFVVKERDASGRMLTRSAGSLAEAVDLKLSIRALHGRASARRSGVVTFESYAREWIASYQGRTSRGLRDATRQGYRADLENHAIPYFGRRPLAELEPRDVKGFAAALAKVGMAPANVRKLLAPVKSMLATAFEDGVIHTNPAANVRIAVPNTERGERERVRALSPSELDRVIAEIPDRHRLLFVLLSRTGLRISEAVALRWSDLDLNRGVLHVERAFTKGALGPPKSRHGVRTIPLTPALGAALRERQSTEHPASEMLVFPGRRGIASSHSFQNRVMKPAAARAGVPWATLHALRHTFATSLFRNGCNAKQVQRLLGHHSAAFTLETYVHVLPEDLPDLAFLDLPVTSTTPAGDNAPTMLELIRQHRDAIIAIAARRGATNVRVFGSAARGDYRADSDIDFLVHFDDSATLFNRGGLWNELHELLGRDIDLVDDAALRDEVRDEILNQAVAL